MQGVFFRSAEGPNEPINPAIFVRFLLSKFSDMQTFAGESMTAEGGMAFGYYKDGAHNPTFAYISKAMEAEKVHHLDLIYSAFCNIDISVHLPQSGARESPTRFVQYHNIYYQRIFLPSSHRM